MKFLIKKSSCQTQFFKLTTNIQQFKAHLHVSNHKPPKANQTLKNYSNSNHTHKVLSFFKTLHQNNISTIDSYSLLFVLKACTKNPNFNNVGKQVHNLIKKLGFEPIVFLQTSLVKVYSLMKNVGDAHKVFDEITVKNGVCWTVLISAYVDNQNPNEAIRLFKRMQMENVEPDQVTLTVALSACADLGALDMGEWIHAYIRREKRVDVDLCLNNALINMYAKCGDIITCRRLFDSITKKDVTTWTSMIVGHAIHGQASQALHLFEEMEKAYRKDYIKVKPNEVTFVGILMACSHAGLLKEGWEYFKSMTDNYGLKPKSSHFGCMVDLICRSGSLREAYEFILRIPIKPNAVIWRTLLGACSLQGNAELGAKVNRRLVELEPGYVGDDVVMSNIYASKGMWDEKLEVRDQINGRRDPGCSSIEVAGIGISVFVTADDDHPFLSDIYAVLESLIRTMKAYGHVPRPTSSLRSSDTVSI